MGPVLASLLEGYQAQAEPNRCLCCLARHGLLVERLLHPDPVPGPGQRENNRRAQRIFEGWRPVAEIQVTPIGVIKYVETSLLPPAFQCQFSSRGLGHCLADMEKLVIPRARPLPCPRGNEEIQSCVHPRSSAIASLMGKREVAQEIFIPKARPLPCQWDKGPRAVCN